MIFNDIRKTLLKFWGMVGSVSVRTKIFGIVLGSTFILSLSFVYQVRFTLQDILAQKSKEQGISIASGVAAQAVDWILINDLYSLHELLAETKENYPDVRYVFVVDTNNRVLAHTFGDGFPLELIGANQAGPEIYQNIIRFTSGQENVWDIAVQIFDGKAGTVRVGISGQSLKQTMYSLTARLGWTIIAVLSGSLLAATFLTWVLTRPILNLVESAKKIAKGDFSPRIDRWANDEIGDLEVAFNQMAEGLERIDIIRQEREQLRGQLLEGVIHAQEDERRRISRELHDSTSQSLTSLIIGLKNIADYCENPEIYPQIEKLREETSKALNDVHTMALQLRPTVLDDLGLEAALLRLIEEWQDRLKVKADLLVHIGKNRLPGDVETALYRMIQEALTNIARHAEARSVSILVERRNGDIVAIIEDDGVGFEYGKSAGRGQLGLLGMQERAGLLHGKLTIESSENQGTSIFIIIPIS
ncbi:MAG: HAMP domain-containing protein [Anaerolineales bacterium]